MNEYEPGEDEQAEIERYLDTSDDCAHLRFNDIDIDWTPERIRARVEEILLEIGQRIDVEVEFETVDGVERIKVIRCYEYERLVREVECFSQVDKLFYSYRLERAAALMSEDHSVD